MNSLAKSKSHLSGLDSARGLAIILVVIFHYVYNHVSDGWLGIIIAPFGLGGVTLFFFLSGFLMERHLTNDRNLLRYFSRRFFRILPAYLVCLAAVLLLDHVTHSGDDLSVRNVTINMLLLQDFFSTPLVIGVIWTLLIEIKFYALAPFIMRGGAVVLRLAPYATIAANTAVFLIRGEASTFLTYLTFCFVGMQFGPWSRGQMSAQMLALIVLFSAAATSVFVANFPYGLAIFVIVNAAIMAGAIQWSGRIPLFPFIGKVSYSWYLYHAALGYPLISVLTTLLPGAVWAQTFIIVIATALTLFVAWLSFTIVERPMITFGYKLDQYLGISPARRAAKNGRSNT